MLSYQYIYIYINLFYQWKYRICHLDRLSPGLYLELMICDPNRLSILRMISALIQRHASKTPRLP